MKKIALNKETLRKLDEKDLEVVRGGAATVRGHQCIRTADCPTWVDCQKA